MTTSALAREFLFGNTFDAPISGSTPASASVYSYNPAITGAFGKPFDVGLCTHASFQCKWTGLTGTLDGQFEVFTSNDGVLWQAKFNDNGIPVVLPVTGAGGHDMIALNDVVAEEFYAIYWNHGGVTGGTVQVIGVGK